ncbi:MAG: hypothetical protein WCI67_01845, partial [Chloroflexales bacterium]
QNIVAPQGTTAPQPTAGETSGPPKPTAAPPQGAALPAPLYVLDNGQIARIERDGKSRVLVTDEKVDIQGLPPIATFAMASTGDMAYVVGDLKADRLVRAGPHGEGRRTIYEAKGHELSNLVWSIDGAQIYLRMLNNREPPDTPSGVYRISAEGGALELLRADDPVDNVANPSPTISGYRPFALSPDGARMLVEIYSLYYGGCGLGVMPTGGGAVVRLAVPPGTKTFCGEATWSPDGAAVYFLAGPESGPTIWRGDAASGATMAMAAADVLSRAPLAMAGGALRFFLVQRDPSGAGTMSFTMADLTAPQAAPAASGAPFSDHLGQVLWAPDGRGAVVSVEPANTSVDLRWTTTDGAPMSLPNTNQSIGSMAWGR